MDGSLAYGDHSTPDRGESVGLERDTHCKLGAMGNVIAPCRARGNYLIMITLLSTLIPCVFFTDLGRTPHGPWSDHGSDPTDLVRRSKNQTPGVPTLGVSLKLEG